MDREGYAGASRERSGSGLCIHVRRGQSHRGVQPVAASGKPRWLLPAGATAAVTALRKQCPPGACGWLSPSHVEAADEAFASQVPPGAMHLDSDLHRRTSGRSQLFSISCLMAVTSLRKAAPTRIL